ncbi:hypothetical protein FIA58_005230 [Flavobacterium jejuense]|uniref:Uncharacterized protein n=1 Tax=Flavobacterium jejuense TaxID=1544455 RepID=A0ABX0ISI9_9FLAO|nr:hypothetical protein [Flavobacterium jejuense]NHN25076.1 hypothetical protein [Flavobacterium jejuense]
MNFVFLIGFKVSEKSIHFLSNPDGNENPVIAFTYFLLDYLTNGNNRL